jgi:hypothetical protein
MKQPPCPNEAQHTPGSHDDYLRWFTSRSQDYITRISH